jgi:hypothetical protein
MENDLFLECSHIVMQFFLHCVLKKGSCAVQCMKLTLVSHVKYAGKTCIISCEKTLRGDGYGV